MKWLMQLFSRRRRCDDLSASIQEHLQEKIDELMDEGMSRAQAEQAAKRAFGNATLIEQRSREEWQWPVLESLLADLRLALRRIRKSPGFATTVILTLSIGIGANTAVFSVIDSVLLKPLSYPHSEQLVALWLDAPGAGGLANFSSGLQLSPSMYVSIPDSQVRDPRMVPRIHQEIADKVEAIPGVASAGFASAVPMEPFDPNWDQIMLEGKTYKGGEPPLRLYNYVSPEYFHAMGTRFIAGRDFTWADIYGTRQMVIVSENFARESWGSASAAIGKRVRQFTNKPWQEVIGVVEDVRQHGVDEKAPVIVYWPVLLNNPYTPQSTLYAVRSVRFAIRSNRPGNESFLNQVQQAVWSVNANLPLASVQTMQDIYGRSLARVSFTLVMLAIAGSMALLLGIIGIYGVVAYTVSQRTREIGIRLALGAQKSELRWMFVRSALVLTATGIAIGLSAAAGVTRFMSSLLFGVSPVDPLTFVAIPLVLAGSAVLASYLPAHRAAAVNPVEALRS